MPGLSAPLFPKAGPPGPASAPTGNPGEVAAAMAQVREAVRIMEKALPKLQPGTKQYEAVVDSIGKISKAIPATESIPGVQNTTLMAMLRDSKEGAMQQALQRMGGPGGAGGPGGPGAAGGPPPMSPPGGAPGMM